MVLWYNKLVYTDKRQKEENRGMIHKLRDGWTGKLILGAINFILIVTAIISSLFYSNYMKKRQVDVEVDAFCNTVESMKQVARNYLELERGYVIDWAKYIEEQNYTMDEALDYIRKTNGRSDRYANIVDMHTYEAFSTYERDGDNTVSCYQQFKEGGREMDIIFTRMLQRMASTNDEDGMYVLGKYKVNEMQMNVISVGTKVKLRLANGTDKDYLLLRLIPVESVKSIFVFPIDYTSGEVGMITKTGDYVIPSNSMKSVSFPDFIRGYNFENDYNEVDVLRQKIQTTDSGLLKYKNSKGEKCYWYYSRFDEDSDIDILGYIPVGDLEEEVTSWPLVFIVCGILMVLIILDGSYILRINKRLRESVKEADRANHAKTRFLSAMSHDIRTPMNAVIGMTNIAKKHTDDPAYVKACLDKVSRSSDHLLTLINDILDISKVESGNMALNPAEFSLEKAIANIANIIRPQAEEKGIRFEIHTSEFPYKILIADGLRINQIFINLLNNAVKYTGEGGTIRLDIREDRLPKRPGYVRTVCMISDTGIGMTEEFQQHMYDSFARENDSRIDKIQGSGLGLSIAKQMVDLMGGTITCESKLGEGTTFTVTLELPVSEKSYVAETVEQGKARMDVTDGQVKEFKGMRVLIAEDNELNWEIINTLLEEYKVKCERAANGKECVEKISTAAEGVYDLILMDVQMPVLNGKDATRQIRQSSRPYVRDIPIYAMTADAFEEDRQECLAAGMNGHIAKPVDINKVLDVLKQVKRRLKDEETNE